MPMELKNSSTKNSLSLSHHKWVDTLFYWFGSFTLPLAFGVLLPSKSTSKIHISSPKMRALMITYQELMSTSNLVRQSMFMLTMKTLITPQLRTKKLLSSSTRSLKTATDAKSNGSRKEALSPGTIASLLILSK